MAASVRHRQPGARRAVAHDLGRAHLAHDRLRVGRPGHGGRCAARRALGLGRRLDGSAAHARRGRAHLVSDPAAGHRGHHHLRARPRPRDAGDRPGPGAALRAPHAGGRAPDQGAALRGGGAGLGGRRVAHPGPPRPAQLPAAAPRADHAAVRHRHPLRRLPRVPRPGRSATHPGVGHDAGQGARLSPHRAARVDLSWPHHSPDRARSELAGRRAARRARSADGGLSARRDRESPPCAPARVGLAEGLAERVADVRDGALGGVEQLAHPDEAVDHPAIADVVHHVAGIPEPAGEHLALVAQRIEARRDDQGRRQPGQRGRP